MPARFNYICLLCPNTYDYDTGKGVVTSFDTDEEARTHLIDYHRIEPSWLRGVQVVRGLSGTLGDTTISGRRWQLPVSGTEVMEAFHEHIPRSIFDGDQTNQDV